MRETPNQREFWDEEAPAARFSHPLSPTWLEGIVSPDSPILDYGCGYGRTIAMLAEMGFQNVTGLDSSLAMLDRTRAALPDVALVVVDGLRSPFPDASFELVILFAVLTSIPEDHRQRAVIADVLRILRPGGHLYVSDLPLQTDARRRERYETARPDGLNYGTFYIDGRRAVMRHHTPEWFADLFSEFRVVERETLSVPTMRGHTADTVQYLLQKPRV